MSLRKEHRDPSALPASEGAAGGRVPPGSRPSLGTGRGAPGCWMFSLHEKYTVFSSPGVEGPVRPSWLSLHDDRTLHAFAKI